MRTLLRIAALVGALGPAAGAAQAPRAERREPPAEAADAEMRSLEARVEDLKERIQRSQARLRGLQEMALGGDLAAGGRAVVVHRNEMGGSFVLESAAFALDGAPTLSSADPGAELDRREQLSVFEGRLPAGNHRLSVGLVYRGRGGAADAPRYKVQANHTFQAEAGRVTRITVVGYEKGGLGTDARDRPQIRFETDVRAEEPARGGRPGAGGAQK